MLFNVGPKKVYINTTNASGNIAVTKKIWQETRKDMQFFFACIILTIDKYIIYHT